MASKEDLDEVKADLAILQAATKADLAKLQSATTTQASTVPQKLVFQKEKKLRSYKGNESGVFSQWRDDAEDEIAAQGLTDKDAADLVYGALEGAAKSEIKCRDGATRKDAKKILDALQEVFGDVKTSAQYWCAFYSRAQREGETIMKYSHELSQLLDGVETKQVLDPDERTKMLRDQFSQNVTDDLLRWELKKVIKNEPSVSFIEVRKVALAWASEVHTGTSTGAQPAPKPRHSQPQPGSYDHTVDCGTTPTLPKDDVVAQLAKQHAASMAVMNQMLAQQRLLIDELRGGRRADDRYQSAGRQEGNFDDGCWHCGDPAHIRRNCVAYKQKRQQESRQRAQPRQAGGSGPGNGPQQQQHPNERSVPQRT